MLTRIFGQINSATSIFIGLFAALLTVAHFLYVQTPEFEINTAWGVFVFLPVVGYSIFGVGMVTLLFGYQWLFEYKYKLVKRHAYFPFFLLVFVLLFSGQASLNLLICLLFVGVILASWFAVYQGDKILGRTLNTGLLIGLGTVLDSKFSVMLVLSFVAYTVFGRFNGRTFLILLVGFFTVLLNALTLEYIILGTSVIYKYIIQIFQFKAPSIPLNISVYHLAVFGVLFVLSLPEFTNTLNRASVFKRQAFTVLMVLAVSVAVLFVVRGTSVFYLAILITTLLALFINYFQVIKRGWLQELILWLMLGLLAVFDLNIL